MVRRLQRNSYSQGQRVLKEAADTVNPSRFSAEVFDSLRLNSAPYRAGDNEYDRTPAIKRDVSRMALVPPSARTPRNASIARGTPQLHMLRRRSSTHAETGARLTMLTTAPSRKKTSLGRARPL